MSAMYELREMLDERGIEYEQGCIEGIASYTYATKWKTQTGNECTFCEYTFYEIEDGYPLHSTRMVIEMPTAEQVIAATVGCETCRNVSDVDGIFVCSECKCQIEGMVVLNGARRWVVPPYCPNCGRQVSE